MTKHKAVTQPDDLDNTDEKEERLQFERDEAKSLPAFVHLAKDCHIEWVLDAMDLKRCPDCLKENPTEEELAEAETKDDVVREDLVRLKGIDSFQCYSCRKGFDEGWLGESEARLWLETTDFEDRANKVFFVKYLKMKRKKEEDSINSMFLPKGH